MADDDDETRLVHKLPTTACDTFKWWHFCDLLETVLAIAEDQAADKPAKNAKTRAAVFAPWTRAARLRGESLYPYLRLLIPTEDVRPKYKLKEKRIAECVAWGRGAVRRGHVSLKPQPHRRLPPRPPLTMQGVRGAAGHRQGPPGRVAAHQLEGAPLGRPR